jgi:hypothetical protein
MFINTPLMYRFLFGKWIESKVVTHTNMILNAIHERIEHESQYTLQFVLLPHIKQVKGELAAAIVKQLERVGTKTFHLSITSPSKHSTLECNLIDTFNKRSNQFEQELDTMIKQDNGVTLFEYVFVQTLIIDIYKI